MKHKPVKNYTEPVYPKQIFYLKNPESLIKFIPRKWITNKITLLTLVTFLSSGFGPGCKKNKNKISYKFVKSVNNDKSKRERFNSFVAPIFIYGSGSGSIGCISVAPPVFISEAEAIDIIYTELKNNGFDFDVKSKLIKDFYLYEKGMPYYDRTEQKIKHKNKIKGHPFYYDLYSKKYNLGIKFISDYNYDDILGIGETRFYSTLRRYNLIKAASELKEKLKKLKKYNSAIFYEPMIRSETSYEDSIKKEKEALRKQVAEFIVWFKNKINNEK